MKKQPQIVIKPYSKKKRRKNWKRFFLAVLTILIFFTVSMYLFLSWLIKKEKTELERLRYENERLRSEIRRFQTSQEAYEEYIRTKLGYIKDGEKIIIY